MTKLLIKPFRVEILGPYNQKELNFRVKSNHPIDVWVVPSKKDADLVMEGGDFNYNPQLSQQRTTNHSALGSISPGTQIVLTNRSEKPAEVKITIEN